MDEKRLGRVPFLAVENTPAEFNAHVYKGKIYNTQIYDSKGTTSADGGEAPFKFYMPTYIDRRFEAQSSYFTLHLLIDFDNNDAYFRHFADMLPKELSLRNALCHLATLERSKQNSTK